MLILDTCVLSVVLDIKVKNMVIIDKVWHTQVISQRLVYNSSKETRGSWAVLQKEGRILQLQTMVWNIVVYYERSD